MNIQQLEYLIAVSQQGSISKAAKSLFVSQPAISKGINSLEQELNIEILSRNPTGSVLTPEGMELLNYAIKIIDYKNDIEKRFDQKSEYEHERLSISSHHYMFAIDTLINFLHDLENEEGYEIYARETTTKGIINDVLTRRSEIGILFVSEITRSYLTNIFKERGLIFTPLYNFTPKAYVREGHPILKKEKVTLEDLSEYPYICYEQEEGYSHLSEELIGPLNPKKIIYVTDRSTMNTIITHTNAYNIGTGIVPESIDVKGAVVEIFGENVKAVVGWIQLENVELSEGGKKLLTMLEDSIEKSI